MRDNDSKFSMWIILAAIVCCALPLLLLSGGLAFMIGLLSSNILLIVFSLILVSVALWLFLKRKNV